MSAKLQPVRGTHDILPDEFEKFHAVVTLARELATLYGFKEMTTPIFEPTEVFSRSMGETSDVVSKEMFTFQTKGEESVTLRPEFTAGIVRAFLSNGMQQHLPLKLFSTGPLFRYERPQKGRQRQFHQVNFEWLGDASPEADVEIIMLAGYLLFYLSGNKGCKLLINTLGDKESRAKYRDALVAYLTPHTKELSEDSQRRLTTNPLRILDSKSPQDNKITEAAPKIMDYLSDQAKARFDKVCSSLNQSPIPFFQSINVAPSLVRGLDYYTDTVFEFVAETGELGAQNTVLAGGRYDGLVGQMGGKPTPAIGFAAGVERLLLLSQDNKDVWETIKPVKITILPFENIKETVVHNIATVLRFTLKSLFDKKITKQKISVEIVWNGSLTKRLAKAAQQEVTHVVLIPEEEVNRRACIIRDMQTRKEKEVSIDHLAQEETLDQLLQDLAKP
jgi:histidyl-tRNA synthetase